MSKKPQDWSRDSEARKIKAGGRRMPGGVMPADAADALAYLQSQGFASSATGCICLALIEAAEKVRGQRRPG